ncbi:MAG TPA: plasmid transfer protein TraA [Streptosporangiaceae bacterium]|nr:plasmid transfer protein TraA [Streptosporangiaceae bacterium]
MSTPDNAFQKADPRARRDPQRRVQGVQGGKWESTGQQRRVQRGKTVNKTRNGGGFNPSVNPTLSINVTKGPKAGATQAGTPVSPGHSGGGTPGASFMSNEDIHKFSEHIRKEGRKRAGERAMDAEQLEQVLRNIPDSAGSMTGARMRARRVSRHLKRIAKAEQLIAKEAAALYSQFEREYEAQLRKISAARPKQTRTQFGWR